MRQILQQCRLHSAVEVVALCLGYALHASPQGAEATLPPKLAKPAPPQNDRAFQSVAPAANSGAKNPDSSTAPPVVKISILPSRTTVSRDGSYGVYADIQNISSVPISLKASETVLVVQPEVSHPIACVDWAPGIFPTQSPSTATPKATSNGQIQILPSEHYEVFWDLSPRSPQTNGMCSWNSKAGDLLGFVPGDYAFTVEGIAHVQTSGGSSQEEVAHTFVETTTLKVGLSLLFTAISSFWGGLLAYFVVFLQPGQDFEKWRPEQTGVGKTKVLLVWCRNALAAGMLASSVTIIASRLSDTQFPIKVSVSDFWGALTIGFVSYFVGSRFIASLASKLVSSKQSAQQ